MKITFHSRDAFDAYGRVVETDNAYAPDAYKDLLKQVKAAVFPTIEVRGYFFKHYAQRLLDEMHDAVPESLIDPEHTREENAEENGTEWLRPDEYSVEDGPVSS